MFSVPTIVVFTKYDKLFDHLEVKDLDDDNARIKAAATRHLQKNCVEHIAKLTGEENFPYVTVSSECPMRFWFLPVDTNRSR